MIRAESKDGHLEVHISGDSDTILRELLTIVLQVLKAFHANNCADIVMQGLVEAADQFATSINHTNFNSKGEEEND